MNMNFPLCIHNLYTSHFSISFLRDLKTKTVNRLINEVVMH